jgi:hypothetical protein
MAWIACAVPGGGTVYVDMAHAVLVEPSGDFTKITIGADGGTVHVREKADQLASQARAGLR